MKTMISDTIFREGNDQCMYTFRCFNVSYTKGFSIHITRGAAYFSTASFGLPKGSDQTFISEREGKINFK